MGDFAPLLGRLAYLELGSPDPHQLAQFYATLFGSEMSLRSGQWTCRGLNHWLMFRQGARKSLLSAGYSVSDERMLRDLRSRVVDSGGMVEDAEADFFESGAISVRDPDGNSVVFGRARQSPASQINAAPLARLQHVVVGTLDIVRMVQFYKSVVGLRESDQVIDEQGVLRTSFMRSDDEHHSFAVFQSKVEGLDHHCYEVADWNGIRDWSDRLSAMSVPIEWGPGRHGPGNNLFAFFNDPDGNWVELSAELEIVTPARPVGKWKHEERTLNSWGRGYLRS